MSAELAVLEQRNLLRRPRVIDSAADARVRVDGTEMICLCSNNYLGLANDPRLIRAAAEAVGRWGVGAGASRLISGTSRLHVELERRLAAFEAKEAAIVTSTGWQANACALAAMTGPGDLIVSDKLNHASIIDAARSTGATLRTYRHGDVERLRSLLGRFRSRHRRCVIVTDGVFSMDGDAAPLAELVAIKREYDAALVVDEAHGTGVLGAGGRGAAEAVGVHDDVDVIVGTLSKALGAMGGFVAGRRVLIDTIFTAARPFVYTTALAPALCGAALAALDVIDAEPGRRRRCLANASRLREKLIRSGCNVGVGKTQIIPVIVGSASSALDLSRRCADAGLLVPAIRPPTVPAGAARLRVSVTATHEWDDLQRLVDVL